MTLNDFFIYLKLIKQLSKKPRTYETIGGHRLSGYWRSMELTG
jgi:hypothetical protein